MFAGHIVIGIFADDDSPLLGLRNLVMPLRCTPICFLIMCNYFNGTWYNHKTWFYKMALDCSNWPLTLLWADTHFPFCWQIMFCVCWFHQSRQRPLSPRLSTYWRRASNIPYADLRHIIIVGNMTFLVREWGLLRWFELLMQRLFWTFYYWRTCPETCRRSRLWTETHWTELTSGQ